MRDDDYGTILRAKGMVEDENGSWIYFDMVPGEYELRDGEPDYTGTSVRDRNRYRRAQIRGVIWNRLSCEDCLLIVR